MAFKKFRNVKWDKKKEFKHYLKELNLSTESLDLLDIISNKNVIVVTFNSFLRELGINYKEHHNEANLMKLYSALAMVYISNINNKSLVTKEITKATRKFKIRKAVAENVTSFDWEKEMIKGYDLSEKEMKNYFSNNVYYNEMAILFAEPFREQIYYDFAYLLNMYVTLGVFFNKYNVAENENIFLIKLEVQQKMIDILSHISPNNFNLVIINLNKWFKKFDKQFYKLLTRKIED